MARRPQGRLSTVGYSDPLVQAPEIRANGAKRPAEQGRDLFVRAALGQVLEQCDLGG